MGLDDEPRLRWLRRAAVCVLVLGLLACAGEGGDSPSDPQVLPPGVTSPPVPVPGDDTIPTSAVPVATGDRTLLPGFGEVLVEVRQADGSLVTWCLLLAETDEQRQRGLMEVDDPELGGYDGMLFRFEEPIAATFWNRNVPQELSIAYLDEDGGIVSVQAMDPCVDDRASSEPPTCPTYPAGGDVLWAVEKPAAAGGVAALGLEPGAILTDTGRLCT